MVVAIQAYNCFSAHGPASSALAWEPGLYSKTASFSKRLILQEKLLIAQFGLGMVRSHPSTELAVDSSAPVLIEIVPTIGNRFGGFVASLSCQSSIRY